MTATTRHSTRPGPISRSRLMRAATIVSGGSRQAIAAITRLSKRRAEAEPDPAVVVHPQPHAGRDRGREHRGHAPVADALGAPALGDHLGHVGGGGREQARPEQPVEQHQHQRQPVVGARGVGEREAGDRQAGDQQHAALADPVGERPGDRGRQRRGVGEQAEEETRHGLRAAEVEDAEGRRRQQLEQREKDREGEAAHHEEARGEERLRVCRRCGFGRGRLRRRPFRQSAGAPSCSGSQARSAGPLSVQTAKRSGLPVAPCPTSRRRRTRPSS